MGTFRDAEGNEREFIIGEDGDVYELIREEESLPGIEEIMQSTDEALKQTQQWIEETLARPQQIIDETEERIRRMGL